MNEELIIRKIQPQDNPLIAKIIRTALEEYGEAKPGTVYTDPTTDELYETFSSAPKSGYFIAELNGEVIGGSGIYPTKNLPEGYAELVKIYLKSEHRRSEEHTSELQSRPHLVCRLLLEKKKKK